MVVIQCCDCRCESQQCTPSAEQVSSRSRKWRAAAQLLAASWALSPAAMRSLSVCSCVFCGYRTFATCERVRNVRFVVLSRCV